MVFETRLQAAGSDRRRQRRLRSALRILVMKDGEDIRMTKQRRVIVEELGKLKTHPTADEVYLLVRDRLPRVSLGTVYRNLEFLSRRGIIMKLEGGGSQMRFDGNIEKHQHIRCIECGRVDDLPGGVELTGCDMEILKETGYVSIERRVEFLGVCPGCRRDKRGK